MAAYHLKRKLRTYQGLSRINQAFARIARQCWIVEQAGIIPAARMRVLKDLVLELQSQISHEIVDKMHAVEDKDSFRFGKTRIAWEHHLNSERPAFQELERM